MPKIKESWNKYKRSKKAWIIIGVLIIILIIILVSHKKKDTTLTAIVTTGNVIQSVSVSGRTESASAVNLGFADQGRVATVSVSEGDHVHQGQILASLDTSDLIASLHSAQAALTIAEAGATTDTTNLENITAEQNTLVQNAYRNLLSDGLAAVSTDLYLNPTLQAPIITGTYTGSEGEYDIGIYASASNSGASFSASGLENSIGVVSPNTPIALGTHGLYIEFPNPGFTYVGTTWVVSIPNTKSPTYVSDYNTYLAAEATRDSAIATAQASLINTGTGNSVAQAQVQEAQAQIDSIISEINKRTIIAPFDGVVASVDIKPGQTTSSITSDTTTQPGITLISENDYEVLLDVPEIDIANLVVGQEASIVLDAYGNSVNFPGTITSIDPAETIVDGVPVYETKVRFTEPDSRIRSGMTATATILTNEHDNVVTIPENFINTNADGSSYVYLLSSDRKTEKQAITTGLTGTNSQVEITSGLTAGETVSSDSLQ